MADILGIDTSNYTTSAALLETGAMTVKQSKQLLPVKKGQLGLRQSDALFHHTTQLPKVIQKLFSSKKYSVECIGVSSRPRNASGSYMPCFLAGEAAADTIAAVSGARVYKTSHQTGHILAALYSADKLCWVKDFNSPFIALHLSGGTTDCLLCTPDDKEIINIKTVGTSLDLKAGQCIDRVGVMLGLSFPCGPELEKLSLLSGRSFKTSPCIKDGDCCLSGLENQCRDMLERGERRCDIAKYCIEFIKATAAKMLEYAANRYGNLSVICAGGVMSNKYIKRCLEDEFSACFASSEFSCDNAAGTALYAALKEGMI